MRTQYATTSSVEIKYRTISLVALRIIIRGSHRMITLHINNLVIVGTKVQILYPV